MNDVTAADVLAGLRATSRADDRARETALLGGGRA